MGWVSSKLPAPLPTTKGATDGETRSRAMTAAVPRAVLWSDISEENVDRLRRFNATLFPVHYSLRFYRDLLEGPREFVQLGR